MSRILIVDDDQDLLQSQGMLLISRGYEVETADNVDSAIEAVKGKKPDLILADLMMEHYDTGFVFCKKVREVEGMSEVPILMQTSASKKIGFTFESATPKEREWMKVDEVLTKPVPFDQLLGKIEKHLSNNTG